MLDDAILRVAAGGAEILIGLAKVVEVGWQSSFTYCSHIQVNVMMRGAALTHTQERLDGLGCLFASGIGIAKVQALYVLLDPMWFVRMGVRE